MYGFKLSEIKIFMSRKNFDLYSSVFRELYVIHKERMSKIHSVRFVSDDEPAAYRALETVATENGQFFESKLCFWHYGHNCRKSLRKNALTSAFRKISKNSNLIHTLSERTAHKRPPFSKER